MKKCLFFALAVFAVSGAFAADPQIKSVYRVDFRYFSLPESNVVRNAIGEKPIDNRLAKVLLNNPPASGHYEEILPQVADKGMAAYQRDKFYMDWELVPSSEWQGKVAEWKKPASNPVLTVNGVNALNLLINVNSADIASLDGQYYGLFALELYILVWDDGKITKIGM